MNCPPTKRQRRLNDDGPTAMTSDDPFGDDEDFTQDDLDEIDVIASQAFPQVESNPASRPVASHSIQNTLGSSSRRPLEVQHAELRRKLKEVEEQIMLKNGEIRLLRDSLKGAQQEKEAQRQAQILLDTQRHKEQTHKEKELSKKVQALQTELQFKKAEIHDMKSRLHSSDRRRTASLLPGHSPRTQSSLVRLSGDSGGCSSPLANGFITKEIFDTHRPSKPAPGKTRDSGDKESFSRNPRKDSPDPFLSKRPAPLQLQGGTLLGLLLQQPLSPSSLGLSHLLSMSLNSSPRSTGSPQPPQRSAGDPPSKTSLAQVQSLARNGLNMLSQSQAHVSCGTKKPRAGLGVLLLLPLVDFHLSECLESLCSSAAAAAVTPGAPALEPWRLEAGLTGFSVEEVALAALRLLHLLVSHSDEVVEAVLSAESLSSAADQKASAVALCSMNDLLQSLLRLCEGGVGLEKLGLRALKTLCVLIQRATHSHSTSWKRVLQVIAAGLSTDSRVGTVSAYVHVLMSLCEQLDLGPQLCVQPEHCVSLKLFQFIRSRPDESATQQEWVQLDLQVVRLLSRMMMQRSEVSLSRQQQCQCHSEMVQTMVLVLHRQWLNHSGSHQPQNSPTVSTLQSEEPSSSSLGPAAGAAASSPWWLRPPAALLREALLLLHWLLLHHCSFSQSCRPLLHMYHQVVPAVSELLRSIPERSESEELALEELCRSDGDDPDHLDTDAVS